MSANKHSEQSLPKISGVGHFYTGRIPIQYRPSPGKNQLM